MTKISDNKHYFLPERYVEPFTDYYLKENNPSLQPTRSAQLNSPSSSRMKSRRHHHSQESTIHIPVVPNLIRTSQHVYKHG